jgi:hypothetical protein
MMVKHLLVNSSVVEISHLPFFSLGLASGNFYIFSKVKKLA